MIGYEIKQVRKKLKMTQLELTNGKIARNLISEIENGNTRLINKNAIEFIQQFLYYSLKKNVKINLDKIFDEFILETDILRLKEIHLICDKFLNYKTNHNLNLDLTKLDSISNTIQHNMLRFELYNLTAEVYIDNDDLDNFLNFKLKCIDILILENKFDELSKQLDIIRPTILKVNRNHTFITITIMSINIFVKNNYDFNVDLYYYVSICFLRMNEYDDAIKYIDLYLQNEDRKSDYSIGLLHKANIYSKSNSYTIARDLYSQASILLLHNEDYLNYSIALSNIIDLIAYSSFEKNSESISSMKYYCDLLANVLEELTNDNVKIRMESKLALGLAYIDNNNKSKIIFDNLLSNTIVNNDSSLLANILTDSLEVYSSLGLIDNLHDYIMKLLELYDSIPINDYCEKLILRYVQLNFSNPSSKKLLDRFIEVKYSIK